MACLHRREPRRRRCDREQLLIASPPDDAEGPIERNNRTRCSAISFARPSLHATSPPVVRPTRPSSPDAPLPSSVVHLSLPIASLSAPFANRDVFASNCQTSCSFLAGRNPFRAFLLAGRHLLGTDTATSAAVNLLADCSHTPVFSDEMSYDDATTII